MELLLKRRLFQKKVIFSCLIFLLICFLAFFFQWIYKPLITNYAGPDFSGDPTAYRWHQICDGFQLDKWVNTLMNFPFPTLPLIPCILAYNFVVEKNGFLLNAYPRIGSYRKFMLKSITIHSVTSGFYFYLTYLVFLVIGMILSSTIFFDNTTYGEVSRAAHGTAWAISSDYYTRSFLSDIFGKYFFNKFPIPFYIIYGFISTFVFGAVYSLFSISTSFLTNKKYLAILIPYLYFVFGSILFSMLLGSLKVFSPIFTFSILTYDDLPSYYSIVPLVFPLVFSLIVIIKRIYKDDKLGF